MSIGTVHYFSLLSFMGRLRDSLTNPLLPLCTVPDHLRLFIEKLSSIVRRINFHNQTHLPCPVVDGSTPAATFQCQHLSRDIQCVRYDSLSHLRKHLVFEGELLDHDLILPTVLSKQHSSDGSVWLLLDRQGVAIRTGALRRDMSSWFNWTVGPSQGLYDENLRVLPKGSALTQLLNPKQAYSESVRKRGRVLYLRPACPLWPPHQLFMDKLALLLSAETYSLTPNSFQPWLQHDGKSNAFLAKLKNFAFVMSVECPSAQDNKIVTEAFWAPLQAGAVPIYLGPEDLSSLIPKVNAFIDVRDYIDEGPAKLAEAVHRSVLKADLAKFHRWRTPVAERLFDALREGSQDYPWSECGVCERLWLMQHV